MGDFPHFQVLLRVLKTHLDLQMIAKIEVEGQKRNFDRATGHTEAAHQVQSHEAYCC